MTPGLIGLRPENISRVFPLRLATLLLKSSICSFNLRGFSKNDPKLQMVKLLTAIKFHDIIGKLDTHLNQEEVDTMVKNNKQTFQEFYDPILIPSQT